MGYYNKRNINLALVITLISVLVLSIVFAAFSITLTVKSNATITPDSGEFKVVFSSSSTSLATTGVSITKTGNASAETPTINNDGNPSISGLKATFTSPGEKIEYTFYARNVGSYDAYLSSIVFDNIKGKTSFKECIAGTGTTSSLVASACNGIKVTTTVLSTSYTDTTLNITNHVLKKNNSELVKVTIEYTSGSSVADGPFTIKFGKIYLTYGSTNLSGTPTLPTGTVLSSTTNEIKVDDSISYIDGYRIYGSSSGVGDLNSSTGKYEIPLTLSGKNKIDFFNTSKLVTTDYPFSSTQSKARVYTDKLTPGKQYVISATLKNSSSVPEYIYFYKIDSTAFTFLSYITVDKLQPSSTFTVEDGYDYFVKKGQTLVLTSSDIAKFSTFQIEEGTTPTAYEAYVEPISYKVSLNSPLMNGDYIDYELGKVIRSSGTEELVDLPKLSKIQNTTILTVNTTNAPSKIEIIY